MIKSKSHIIILSCFLIKKRREATMNDSRTTAPERALNDLITEIKYNGLPDIKSLLEAVKIDFNKELPPPPVILKIYDSSIASIGNFSLIIGKAKSRKTFFVTMALAALVKKNSIISGETPPEKNIIILFDTEQGEYHVQKIAHRIKRLIGFVPDNILIYHLRKYSPSERLSIIEYAINNTKNIGFVVIDGIRDLVTSINDEEQATATASKLLKWTEELQIHIMAVLHQNKADNNARGHLGSELVNKAETILSITKDPKNDNISIVEAEYCRDKDPRSLAFEIDEDGLPFINIDWCPPSKQGKKTIAPEDIPLSTHTKILSTVFNKEPKQKYTELVFNIKSEFKKTGISFGDNKSKDFIQYYINEELVKIGGKSPKTLYEFKNNYSIPYND